MCGQNSGQAATYAKFEQTDTHRFESFAPLKKTRWYVQSYLQQTDNYREELAKERSETERMFILTVLARKRRRAAAAQRENGWSSKAGQRIMSNSDPELHRLVERI